MQVNLEKLNSNENCTYLFRQYTQPSFRSPRHFHKEFELAYIEESYGKLYVGNSIINFKKGDLFFFAPRLIHCFKNPIGYENTGKTAKAICIFFLSDFLGDDFLNRQQAQMLNSLFQKSNFGLHFPEPSAEIIELLNSIKPAKNLNGIINLLLILDKLAKQKNATVLSDPLFKKYYYRHSEDDRIEKVMNYVIKNSDKKIREKEVSDLVQMSEAGFSRFFKSRTERNFTEFINEIRISKAKKLLIESNKLIKEISMICGYENLSHFNRQFKLYNCLSPKEFRESFDPIF